jgi:hypothetical protein
MGVFTRNIFTGGIAKHINFAGSIGLFTQQKNYKFTGTKMMFKPIFKDQKINRFSIMEK